MNLPQLVNQQQVILMIRLKWVYFYPITTILMNFKRQILDIYQKFKSLPDQSNEMTGRKSGWMSSYAKLQQSHWLLITCWRADNGHLICVGSKVYYQALRFPLIFPYFINNEKKSIPTIITSKLISQFRVRFYLGGGGKIISKHLLLQK